ncbi:hypothetical protein EAY39_12595 [Vibrio anguillarum]|uniref:tyrosine-type recombinase/integrase n=2 Tax=Vibrio anguillarum TaxID=55601 RepID=UPI00188A32E9|nr:hypothetical protein [Vibrio anguillarum]MBF4252780.1 hypothetical protein [Vibrio anguillarum]MBF4341604.1 hypothetical protein [Vibrio anguillarum]
MMKNQLPSVVYSDSELIKLWKERQKKLKRFDIELPDLSDVINPNSAETKSILNRLINFNKDRGGLSANTLKMLVMVLKKWAAFCKLRDVYAFPLMTQQTVELFLMDMVVRGYSIATISQYRNQIGYIYNYLKLPNPVTSTEVKAFMKSLKEDHVELTGTSYRQKQASAFRRIHLNRLIALNKEYQLPKVKWTRIRDIALISLAYATCLREGEICRIMKRHVIVSGEGHDRNVMIKRTKSKTTTNVKAKHLKGVYAQTFLKFFDSISPLIENDDYIFSHTSRGGLPLNPTTPMSGLSVDRAFRRQFIRLSEDDTIPLDGISPWTGHSARVGRVQDGYQIDKLNSTQLRRLGDWSSDAMIMLYLRDLIDDENDGEFSN